MAGIGRFMVIRIKNLRLRTIIGIEGWERRKKQDVVLNIRVEFNGSQAAATDRIDDSVDYKKITKKIIRLVEDSEFFLLEKLVSCVADAILNDERVQRVWVEIDKPHALRFADSVSMEVTVERP